MNISIKIYPYSQYKKGGALKKNAKTERGIAFYDVGETTKAQKDLFYKDVVQMLKDNYTSFETPYIFTHIKAQNKVTGEMVTINENVGQFITSPMRLAELLGIRK